MTDVDKCHPRFATIDHKKPLSRGGRNTADNKALACYLCNQEKGDMLEEEFKIYRKQVMLGVPKAEARALAQNTYADQRCTQPWSRAEWDAILAEDKEE